jgi:glycosyltransferase involved in cell wall biosynthesis
MEIERKRVLIVVNVSWFFLSHRLDLAKRAKQFGYDVHIATRVTSDADRGAIQRAGLTLHDFPIGRGESGPIYDFMSFLRLLVLFRRVKPDLLHLVTIKPIVLGGLAARVCRLSRVVIAFAGLGNTFVSDGWFARLRRTIVIRVLRSATAMRHAFFIVQNDRDGNVLLEEQIAEPSQVSLIRGSGVDISRYIVAREPDGPVRVLLAARMLKSKGVLYFAEAAKRLRFKWPDAEFVLAGAPDPSNPDSLTRAELRALQDGGCITWLGQLADMPSALARSHVVALPTYYGEGVPKILIEAAACGRPAVTTDVPGCRDIVVNEETGLTVAPHDVDALTTALDRLIADASLRQRFGAAARRRVESGFDLETVLRQTMEIYAMGLAAR